MLLDMFVLREKLDSDAANDITILPTHYRSDGCHTII